LQDEQEEEEQEQEQEMLQLKHKINPLMQLQESWNLH
jgi:hypothetical protein